MGTTFFIRGFLFAILCHMVVPYANAALICATPPSPGSWDLADNAQIDIPIVFDVGDIATTAYTVTQARIKITHTYAGDLGGKLLTPDGTIAHLWQLGDGTVAPSTPTASNCSKGGYDMIFQDTGGGPILKQSNQGSYCIGTNLDAKTGGTGGVGSPFVFTRSAPASIGVRGTATPINLLSTLAGHPVVGAWKMRVKDSYAADVGTVTQSCIDITYAGFSINFYVSTNATCSDKLSSKTFNEGQTGYLCYSISNKGTETFEVQSGNASNTAGIDLSSLDHGYTTRDTVGSTGTVISSFIAGSGLFTVGTHIFTGSALVHGTDIKFTSTGTLSFTKSVSITVLDVTAPVAPTVTSAGGDLSAPFFTIDSTPTITGTGETNTLITIKNGSGVTVGTGMTNGSGVFSITFSTTSDDTRNYTITNTDVSGNISSATLFTLTIDTTAPSVAMIVSIGGDLTAPFFTNNSTPTVTGTAESDTLITLTDGSGTLIGTGMTDGSGNYSIISSLSFVDGIYDIGITSTDNVGNISNITTSTFTIDTTAPITPTIANPINNSLISDTTPTLTGTGEANTIFTFTNAAGIILGTGTIDGSGNWTYTPSSPIPEGSNTLSITTTDTVGNTSISASVVLIIDSLVPSTPIVSNVAGDTTSPYLTNNTFPTITGTAEANSIVEIQDASGTTIGTTIVDVSGNWIYTLLSALPEGFATLTTTSIDTVGNISPALSIPIQIDITGPTAPTIANPTANLMTNDSTPTINGTGEPGSTFAITDASGSIIATGVIDLIGNYSITPTVSLPDGSNTLTIVSIDTVGNTSSPTSVTFTVDTGAPTPLTITTPIDGSNTGDNTPTINGTGEPGTIFAIMDASNIILGTGTVDPSGNYAYTPLVSFPDGNTIYSVTLTDRAGNTTTVVDTIFTIDTTAPSSPTIATPINNSHISDTTPTLTGTGEANTVFTLTTAIGLVMGTGTVDASGNWIFTPAAPLPEGSNTLSVTTTDTVGNTSTSASVVLIIDSLVPSTPVVSNVAGVTTSPYLTNTTTPTITGTGEANSTVEIKNASGTTIGTATADAIGYWILTPSSVLPEGVNNLTITATDATGNISVSTTLLITVDTTPPVTPNTPGTLGGDATAPFATADATPTITGSGTPGDLMTIKDGSGTILTTAIVNTSGSYSLTPTSPLPDGVQTLSLTATDMAGNTSVANIMTVTIDVTPPDTILLSSSPAGLSGSTTLSRSIALGFTSTESGSTFQCAIDAGAYIGCVTPYTYAFTTDGAHTIRVRSIDRVGNIDPTPLTIGFTLYTPTSGGSTPSTPFVTLLVTIIPTTPVPPLVPVATPTQPNKINTPKAPILVESPPPSTLAILSAQDNNVSFIAKIAGTSYPVYELKDRVTEYVCPRIVKMYDESSLQATDISRTEFSEDIHSVLMFRGLEQGEEASGATFTAYQRSAVALNDRLFEPTRSVTRAEFVKMLVRSLSCRYKFIGTDSGFSDVDKNKWYAEYITFGVKNGWMNGYSDGGFHPDAPITRAEAAKILANAIDIANPKTTTSIFDDVPDTSTFAPYIESLQDAGIFRGRTDTTFAPDQYIPRTEVSRIIYRTFLGGQR